MASYKKSFLSVAAAIAMSASVASADYLPLANENADEKWILFGASGFLSDGTAAGEAGQFTITDADYILSDSYTGDELFATSGLTVTGGTGGDLATLKALNSDSNFVEVRVDTQGATFNETEPTRTIYVDTDNDGTADFAFTYKAQLEGETLQYRYGESESKAGDAYSLTIDYSNTYDNPAVGTYMQGDPAVPGTEIKDLVGANNLIDYRLSNNPINYLLYDEDLVADGGDRDAAASGESVRLYSYDANNGGLWTLFDSRYNNTDNDFVSLDKGRAYWGRMALDVNRTAGLVLGSSTITATDYQALNLTEGWNLVSFNNQNNSKLRNANTGLLVTIGGGGDVELKDSSENQSVSVTLVDTNSSVAAQKINFAIVEAKAKGTLPKVFDLRAFPTANDKLALISNKKFSIYDTNESAITIVTTLAGGAPISHVTRQAVAVNNLDSNGTSSKYGEYAMVIKPLTGAGTAASLGNAKLNIRKNIESVSNDMTTVDINTSLAIATGAINAVDGLKAIEFDINQDGTMDHTLIASTEPFYLRDQTFSRVFKYVDSGTSGKIAIRGTGAADDILVDINTDSNATDVGIDINNSSAFVMATDDNNVSVVIIATDESASEFTVYHNTGGDNLEVSTVSESNADLVKGSVADVYSLGHLAKQGISNVLALDANAFGSDHNVTFAYTTISGHLVDGALITDINTSNADAIEEYIRTDLTTLDIRGTVDNNTSHIIISSADIIALYADSNTTGSYDVNATATLGGLADTSLQGDLAADLKYNSVYAPNYVMDGPLYTMREAGFDLKALVTGTMPMDGASTMQWDSIDLTRVPSEWFDSQDYNLFDTDEQAGYWAYLEQNGAANPLTIGNVSLTPMDYVHYYDGETTTNAFSTNIKVAVNGIDETRDPDTVNGGSKSARVTVSVGGKKTELTRESQNLYTGKINFYEVEGVSANSTFTMIIDVADGLGNKISTTTSTIDNQKPTAPTASYDGTSLTISSPTEDVAAYYVFDNIIPEIYEAGDELLRLENEPDGEVIGSGICGADVEVADAPSVLKIVAVDGEGEIYYGNVSDSEDVAYMAIAKDRIILSDINNGENEASVGGTPYSTTCAAGTPVTTNDYAMQLTSMTSTKTAKIAFPVMASGVDLTGTPITVYVRNADNDAVAKITYAPAYEAQEVFVMLDGEVFGYTLPGRAAAEATTPSAGINLNSGLKTDVIF